LAILGSVTEMRAIGQGDPMTLDVRIFTRIVSSSTLTTAGFSAEGASPQTTLTIKKHAIHAEADGIPFLLHTANLS